jgi:hypothetical protein
MNAVKQTLCYIPQNHEQRPKENIGAPGASRGDANARANRISERNEAGVQTYAWA